MINNEPPSKDYREELKVSATPVMMALVGIGILLLIITGDMNRTFQRNDMLLQRIFLYLLPFLGWVVGRYSAQLGKYFLVIGGSLYLFGFGLHDGISEMFSLLFIPIGLAAAMIGTPVGVTLAVILTATMGIFHWISPATMPERTVLLGMLSIWAMAGIMVAVYQPLHQVSGWVWKYYHETVKLNKDTASIRIELNQTLEELLHMNRQLALANEKQLSFRIIAEEAQKTKAAFVAKVSHEFRTPLNMIIGLVSLMIDNPQIYGRSLPKAMLDDLVIIHRNCEHLTGMINDVLALSQAETGRLTLQREYVNLREIIEEALEVVNPLVTKKGLVTRYNIPDLHLQIYCDRTRIRQVLLNLVSNAARFTEQGSVSILVEEENNHLLIRVSDTGPGIPAKDLERIFDPFCQGSSSRVGWEKGGTGLGLTISKQFIELHGGKIWAESQPGKGATFFFTLPKDQTAAPIAAPQRWISARWIWIAQEGKSRFSSELLQRPRIVLFDPENILADVLATYNESLEFTACNTLTDLLQEVKTTPANLILINADTLEHLNQVIDTVRQAVRDTPVIGSILPHQTLNGLSRSVLCTLVKPLTSSDLVEALQRLGVPVRRVLLVDDDEDILSLYSRMLKMDDAFREVITATNGREALAKMKEYRPDVVLLDISMPDMNGIRVLLEKDGDEALASIPVVIVSAMDLRSSPLQSRLVVATMADGIGPVKLLECAVGLSEILIKPELSPPIERG